MKQLLFSTIALLISIISFAQVPNLMNYQAVARNSTGVALSNPSIRVRLSANENGGAAFYTETRNITTNHLGLFNVQIGSTGALSSSGNLNATNWLDATKTRFLKVEMDVNNSGLFTEMGSQQLVSVPYAIAAGTAQTALTAQTAQLAQVAKKLDNPFIGFRAHLYEEKILTGGNSTTFPLVFTKQDFDSSNVYNNTTGEFIAPESGMYYLHARVTIRSATSYGMAFMYFISNYQLFENGHDVKIPVFPATNTGAATIANPNSQEHSIITHLTAGEKVRVSMIATVKSTNWELSEYDSNFFEAYKIN